jgi:hypothetical protein
VSFTRWLSGLAVRYAGRGVAVSLSFFTIIIVVHVVALLFWTHVTHLVAGLMGFVLAPWAADEPIENIYMYRARLRELLEFLPDQVLEPWFRLRERLSPEAAPGSFVPAVLDMLWVPSVDSPQAKAAKILALLPNVARLIVALAFVLSFALRPLIQQPLSLLWRRIVESDKPIATMVLGGTAAAAKFVQEVAKALAA